MPLTPGVLWEPNGSRFTKKVMKHGISFPHIQWLYYLQETDLCIDRQGNRVQIEHAYHRGEKRHGPYTVDGYLIIDGEEIFLEFLGEFLISIILIGFQTVRIFPTYWNNSKKVPDC